VPIKNHGFLIQVIKRLKEVTKHPFKLFIVGDGEERANIESMILDAGLSYSMDEQNTADITFTSWIKDVDRVYAGCDIVTLCSLNEGTPVSLIEAQAAGLPIVSTRVGGIQNVVLENETAFLTAKDDLVGFTEYLKILVEQKDKRLEMADKGWEFVKDNFHFTRLVKDMDSLYQELLKEKGVRW
jgi:glycosyltransferase involved in cell wall biosynthesis